MSWQEWIGIAATCLVLLSFLQKSEVNIRRVNMIGSVVFVVYGVLINSLSVWLLNGVCILVNIYKLFKLSHASQKFKEPQSVQLTETDPQQSYRNEYDLGYSSGYAQGYDDGFKSLVKTSQYNEIISSGTKLKSEDK